MSFVPMDPRRWVGLGRIRETGTLLPDWRIDGGVLSMSAEKAVERGVASETRSGTQGFAGGTSILLPVPVFLFAALLDFFGCLVRSRCFGVGSVSLQQDGYSWIRKALPPQTCETLGRRVERFLQADARSKISSNRGSVVGGRNLLAAPEIWRELFDVPAIFNFVQQCVGDSAGVVRILFFDKPPGQGWALPLHRDRTIAVADHPESLEPFKKPTVKAGTPHVEATDDLLQQMITLRIHLDPMGEANGSLFVVPGSHQQDEPSATVDIHCDRGDVFVMRPLLLHGSHAADPKTTMHRRTLHLEISPQEDLPGACRWNRFEPLIPRANRPPSA